MTQFFLKPSFIYNGNHTEPYGTIRNLCHTEHDIIVLTNLNLLAHMQECQEHQHLGCSDEITQILDIGAVIQQP